MTIRRGMISISIIALLLASLLAPAMAYAGEPITPTSFYGEVFVNETPAPSGTVITGRIVGAVGSPGEGSIEVTEPGKYGGDQPLDLKLSVFTDSNRDVGKEIEFLVKLPDWTEAQKADQTATYDSDVHELNLTVGEVPTQYTLDVDTVGSGSVTKDPDQVTYAADTVVELTAIADPDWSFSEWSGDLTGSTNPETITMDADKTVTATFTQDQYILTINTVGSGSVDQVPAPPYYQGDNTVVTLTANPAAGWSFSAWGDDLTGSTNPETITMDGNKTVTATFTTTETFTITATAGDNGTISPSGDVVVNSGASRTFTITPNTGYAVDDVLVDDVSEGAVESYTFENVTADHTIAASFATTETFTITATAGDNGTISPSGDVVVNSGASLAFTITPETGFTVADVLVDSVSEGAISSYTFENVTADHTIAASFAEVTGDLGEMIIATPSGGTLILEAGTYTGDVTIDKPITITGTPGETIISGGIHIVPLDGSNVTIENLTITGYTDYGIWIELVDIDDVFTIRNNTIQGVEGSEIGIQVDEVEAGGSLIIRENAISGNDVGVKLLEAVTRAHIGFNNIAGNDVGLELLAVGEHQVGAARNWWGDISGPEEENWNPGGIGDKIVTYGLGYYPWLTREFQTVLDDNIAYFGLPAVELNTGWNIISTPVALDPVVEWEDSDNISRTGVDTWGDYVALGDGLSTDNTSPAYRFDGQTQAWVSLTGVNADYPLKPCDAIYVQMDEPDIAPILFSPNVSVPSKDLYSGWNLVSLAWLPTSIEAVYGLPADEALVTVEEVTGSFTGYKLVVSPGVNANEPSWIYIAGGPPIDTWTDPNVWPPPDGYMLITSGYWVFMLNDGTLAGFAFTPVSLSLPPAPDGG